MWKTTLFGTRVPNSGSLYNKGVGASLLIYVLFIVLRLINTWVVEIHKMYNMYKIDIVNNLHCFDNTLIISCCSSCQLLVSVVWCYTLMSSHFIHFFRVVFMGSVYKHSVLLCMIYIISAESDRSYEVKPDVYIPYPYKELWTNK